MTCRSCYELGGIYFIVIVIYTAHGKTCRAAAKLTADQIFLSRQGAAGASVSRRISTSTACRSCGIANACRRPTNKKLHQICIKSAYSIEMPFGRMDADLWSVGAACLWRCWVPDPVHCLVLFP
jgi:hypothetical protein